MSQADAFTGKEKHYVRQIERRIAYLEDRIANYQGGDDSYDRGEVAALRWALVIVCEATGVKQVLVSGGPA